MRIAIGSDHRGLEAINAIAEMLARDGHEINRFEPSEDAPSDYPEPAFAVSSEVVNGRADRGVLVCGTGVGTCIAANKLPGVRAASVADELTAEISRSHIDANVICLSADLTGKRQMERIVSIWLATAFQGGRHARRIEKITLIENGLDPSDQS
jgi:ribose 5-phosphate isomerase B